MNEDDYYSDDEDRAAFGNIRIGWEAYQARLRNIKHNDPDTTFLNLNMHDDFTDEAWARVGHFLQINTHVRRLKLSCCELGNSCEFESLMEGGMKENTSLRGLSLSQNQQIFYYGGSELLATYLEKNKNVEDLDLAETDVTPDELRVLMPALDGSKIEVLDLSHGMLQDDMNEHNTPSWRGVLKIFEDIHLPELVDLNLSHCQGMGECCKAVAHLLKKRESKLRTIDLSSNELYGDCVDILKDALKDNITLKHLDLSYNEDIDVEEWMAELKEKKSSLQVTYKL